MSGSRDAPPAGGALAVTVREIARVSTFLSFRSRFVDTPGNLPYVRALKHERGGGWPPTFRRPAKDAVVAAGFETRRRTAGHPGAVVFSCPVGDAAPGFSVTCRSASGRAGRWDVKTVYEEVM
jgi:hypothetical protein